MSKVIQEDRTKQIINNYINHAEKYINENKKLFSSWATIYNKVVKKNNVDPAMDYTKEIIKRMERDKVTSQTAMQISENLMPEMQNIKKDVLIMGIPFLIGVLLAITFTILIIFCKPLDLSNHYLIGYLIGLGISTVLIGFGSVQRKKVKNKTLTNMMLFQAATAYGAAKMQGQGSFGAFRILEEMKTKQGKELQIKIPQPQTRMVNR
jgi:hypothetical protein